MRARPLSYVQRLCKAEADLSYPSTQSFTQSFSRGIKNAHMPCHPLKPWNRHSQSEASYLCTSRPGMDRWEGGGRGAYGATTFRSWMVEQGYYCRHRYLLILLHPHRRCNEVGQRSARRARTQHRLGDVWIWKCRECVVAFASLVRRPLARVRATRGGASSFVYRVRLSSCCSLLCANTGNCSLSLMLARQSTPLFLLLRGKKSHQSLAVRPWSVRRPSALALACLSRQSHAPSPEMCSRPIEHSAHTTRVAFEGLQDPTWHLLPLHRRG